MKKKITTTVVAIASVFYLNLDAQTINLDTSFGNNGIVSIPLTGEADDLQIIESSDNKIFAFGKDLPSLTNKIYKLDLNGSLDTTFGNAGILTLPNYISDFKIIPQGNDKILVAFQKTSNNIPLETSILRYNSNGTLDTTFATNGEFKTSYDGADGFRSNNTVVLPGNSIILATGTRFIKLSENGVIDTSYGINGSIDHTNSGNIQLSNSDILDFYDTKIEKINTAGDLISTFATNGTFTYQNAGSYFSKQKSDGSIYSLDLDGYTLNKISSNGASSNIVSLTTDNNTLEYYSSFVFVGDKIYYVGTTSADSPFIVSYDNSGNLTPLNSQNSYKETAIPTGNYTSILAKNNALYIGGDRIDTATNQWYYVVTKYNITNSTLATNEVKTEKASFNIFPNPANKGNTLYFNRAQGYELYDMSGKLLGKEKNALTIDTSKLNTGVYLIKTSEGEVKKVIVK
ncbi:MULTISPECIES: delta-60 repeat domain-containing protein [Chryseobacterium]|uniref:delta-60 repeat domain-containing protein n=1 Tax=Chryseobacterium TaxID=59732 RepID=UPI00195DCAC1|nr:MULTISPECIES: T9SS type A sorting domain-containing protein [Chryseobacterium]MBM7419259.1 putative delta-60 repeat protein [Chryseobacterium sp. JUb44]MDH6209182.1 putative delta-60 repeat protein [Chryseobacterium sp. BIGb0186]WSO12030.1 T9SS type A sorting domain-containing protein [Chryseobacterium scophthalmum]